MTSGNGEEMRGGPGEWLDADAVCAQCGTVNAEGTLICRTCGNNLRDQRSLRMAADQMLDEDGPGRRRRFMLGALTVLGFLLVIWMLLNVDDLASSLVTIEGIGVAGVDRLWEGEEAQVYETLLSELDTLMPERDVMRNAVVRPIDSPEVSGTYVLADERSPMGTQLVGTARVLQEGPAYHFVARVSGGVELRGRGFLQSSTLTAEEESAGAKKGDRYYPVSGVAIKRDNGSFECYGITQASDAHYEFVACKLPE